MVPGPTRMDVASWGLLFKAKLWVRCNAKVMDFISLERLLTFERQTDPQVRAVAPQSQTLPLDVTKGACVETFAIVTMFSCRGEYAPPNSFGRLLMVSR